MISMTGFQFLSIWVKNFGLGISKIRKIIKINTQIHTQKLKFLLLYFKLSHSKFARDLQNAQTQIHNPNTQKIENPNPNPK
jgi:hypothetical protein